MATISYWEVLVDPIIRQVLRDVKRDNSLLRGSLFTKRQTFLSLLTSTLARKLPTANIVVVRHGQIHQCRADHIMRKVEGPLPALSDFFGLGSCDYYVYICRRGSFTNFSHGGPLDLVWGGRAEVARECGSTRNRTILLR